jgi:hypothetical protein
VVPGEPVAWDEEEEEGDGPSERDRVKKKQRSKSRELVYDESLGGLVSQRRRKPGRQRESWEDLL